MSTETGGWEMVGESRDRLGESALWHPREAALYWIDFYGPSIQRLDPATGDMHRWVIGGTATVGSLAFAGDGKLLVAIDGGVHLFDLAEHTLTLVADPNAGRPGIGYNDAKMDRNGRYWVGTFDSAEKEPRGILYRLDADGRATVGDSGYVVCNGPAFSPGGEALYFSDSIGRRLIRYDLDAASGALSMPCLLADLSGAEGMPDGLCVDREGAIYCAHYGGGRVTRFSFDGRVLETFPLPVRNVTSCCLGGPGLDVLYVTTGEDAGAHRLDGAVFARRVSTPGLAEPLWRGG